MPPPLRIPSRWTLVAATGGVLALIVKAALGETDDFGERFVGDLLGVVAGVAFAAAGLNEVARRWLRRPWTVRTARTVFDYMELLVNELAATAARCYAIVEPIAGIEVDNPIGWAFKIPGSESSQSIYDTYKEAVDRAKERVGAEPEVERVLVRRATVEAPLVAQHVEQCRTLMAHIGAYRENQAHALEELSASMWSNVAGLHQIIEDTDVSGRLVASHVSLLLFQCHEVARVLSDGFHEVWDLVAEPGQEGAILVRGRHARWRS